MQEKEKNSLNKYIEEIGREVRLTEAEEKELAGRIGKGDEKALEQLARANLRFVVSMARKYQNRGIDMEDLVSEGNIGLMRAAARFDAKRGVRFVSYAAPFVRKCMEQAVEEQAGLYRVPKNEGTTAERKRSKALSADAPLGGRENVNLLSLIENPDAPQADSAADRSVMTKEAGRLLSTLNEREREVLVLFFGINGEKQTFAEIGERMGLKRERVRQIRDKALRKISRKAGNGMQELLIGE